MDKIKKIYKYDNIILIIILFLSFLGSFKVDLVNSDEAWTFSMIYQMNKGYTIYKDINVIITPLFFYLIKFIFEILGTNFFVYRLCNIIFNIIIYLVVYNILKKLINNKTSSFLYTILIFFICSDTLNAMCSYNTLALIFYLTGILLNFNKKTNRNVILQGFIVFLVFMSKQNIGIYYILGLVLNTIFYYKLEKQEIIKFIKIISVFIILLLVYVIYLLYNNNFYNFINYCFLGIKEFNLNFRIDLRALLYLFMIIISVLLTVFSKNNINKNIIRLELFSLPMCLISYPIFNSVHMRISIIGVICVIMSIMESIIIKDFLNNSKKRKIIYIITIITITFSIYNFSIWAKYVSNKKYIDKALYGVMINPKDDLEKNIENVTNYIKNNPKKTIILSPYSKIYNIVLDYNNGIFDLPFIGNFGKEGEEGLIRRISELKDVSILIEKDEKNLIYQESIKARQYIQNNFVNVGEIEQFYIFEN